MKAYLRLMRYLAPYKVIILITWILSLLVIGLQALSVWVGANFLERLLSPGASTPLLPSGNSLVQVLDRITARILTQASPFRSLIWGVVVLVGTALLTVVLRFVKLYIFSRMNAEIVTRIRSEMFDHLVRMDLLFSRKYRPGEITSLFIMDVNAMRNGITMIADRIFMQPIRLLLALGLMFSLSIQLTLWTLLFLVLSWLIVHQMGNRIEVKARKLMERLSQLQGQMTEYLSALILARGLGKEQVERDRFQKAYHGMAMTEMDVSLTSLFAPDLVRNFFLISGGILLIIGGHQVLVDKTLSGDVLIKIMLLLPVASTPIEALASLYVSLRGAGASAKRVYAFLDQESRILEFPDAREVDRFASSIELSHVSYAVDGKIILEDVSLNIPKGSKIIFFGPSGAGKTTLLSLMAGFAYCTQGSLRIDGSDIRELQGASWRKRLGIVTQEPILLNGTVRENLLYAEEGAQDGKLEKVMREALLWDKECIFSQGLDTPVGNRGELISGGERQRLTIARALLNDPDILLMDEPSSMLDMEGKAKLKETIDSVSRGRTLMLVTHDAYLRDLADIEVQIEAGRVVSSRENHPRGRSLTD